MKIKEKNDEGYSGQSETEEIKNCESLLIDLGRKENKKQRSNLNESSTPMHFFKFSLKEQERILTTKVSYFKLILHKQLFRDDFQETHDEISKEISKFKFKEKSIYFIQHICEEYLVFWFLQIELISEFAKSKTVMKVDSELYELLIHLLLNYDNLAFIKEIW